MGSTPLAPGVDEVVDQLRRIDWNHMLRKRPGWWWDETTGHLWCSDDRELVLTTVRKKEHSSGRTGIIFCRPAGGCEPCDERPGCLRSDQPRTSKHVEVSVPTPIAARLRELMGTRRARKEVAAPQPAVASTSRRSKASVRSFPIAPLTPAPALFAVLPSLFLPATARALVRAAALGLTVTVTVNMQPPPPPKPVLVAESVGEKQRRRNTWQQHFDRNALSPEAQVRVGIAGGDALRRMLCGGCDDRAAA